MPTLDAMKISREDLNPCTVKLEVECAPEQVQDAFTKALKQYSKKIRIPGFRPGQAPRGMIEKMISPDEIKGAAAEIIVNQALRQALEQENLTPHDSPAVTLTEFDQDSSKCLFTAKIPLAPVVELGDYKGLPSERPTVDVTEEDIDQQLEELRKRRGKREAITDRGATEGDIAVVNIKKEGESGDGRTFMTIVGQTFPALDEALTHMNVEEMKSLELTFPNNFQEKDWAGQTFKSHITLRSLNSMKMPELDDAFAQSLPEDLGDLKSENLKDLRNKIRERMLAAKQEMSQEYVNERLQDELLNRSTIHVPDTMWESVANQRLRELEQEARQQGRTIEDYAKENGMTIEQMIEAWQAEAKTQVMRAVAAREIFIKEKLTLTNGDLTQMLIQMAYEYQIKPDDLLSLMKKNNNYQELEIRAIFKKVIEFLNMHANVTDLDISNAGTKKTATSKKEKETKPASSDEKSKKSSKKKSD